MLFLDIESYGPTDLPTVGPYVYWESARVILLGYAIDDGPVRVWDRINNTEMPDDLHAAFESGCPIVAHNSQFDRLGVRTLNATWARPERWGCTMALANSLGLPGGLDPVAWMLGQRKGDEDGKLKKMFTEPPMADPDEYMLEWGEFVDYCRTDVHLCRQLWLRLPHWNWEADLYALDQRINDRGMKIDTALTLTLAAFSERVKDDLDTRMCELTDGRVEKCTQRQRVLAELRGNGADVTDTTAATLATLLDDPAHGELAQLAMVANKASTAKHRAALNRVMSDGRLRGTLKYCGAARTRRWSGQGFQTQNLPSRGLPSDAELDEFIEWARYGGTRGAALYAGDEGLAYASGSVRRIIRASDGKLLYVADLSNIEGRVLAWLADEAWKIEAFREYDAGTGPDVYLLTAQTILNRAPESITKIERNVYGKVPDLACGYQSGVRGLMGYARLYDTYLADHYETVKEAVPATLWNSVISQYAGYGGEQARELGADQRTWITGRAIVETWRLRHPAVCRLWDKAQEMLICATVTGEAEYGRLRAEKRGKWTVVILPSGRVIPYLDVKLGDDKITYRGTYARVGLYGGKIVENIVQSVARDVLAEGLRAAANYEVLFTVHDEIIVESNTPVPLDTLMSSPVSWAPGLPLAAKMTVRERYGK